MLKEESNLVEALTTIWARITISINASTISLFYCKQIRVVRLNWIHDEFDFNWNLFHGWLTSEWTLRPGYGAGVGGTFAGAGAGVGAGAGAGAGAGEACTILNIRQTTHCSTNSSMAGLWVSNQPMGLFTLCSNNTDN